MKHLKSYKVFESSWSIEEYVDFIQKELSKCNITAVGIKNTLISYKDEIEGAFNEGVPPKNISDDIIKTMELETGTTSRGIKFPGLKPPTTIKYL